MSGIAAGGGDVGARDLDGFGFRRTDFAEAMEFSEGAGLGSFEAGFGALDGSEFPIDAFLINAEAEIAVAITIFAIILSFVIGQALVGDGGFDGPGATHAPLSDCDVLDEMEFEDGARLERIDIVLFEFFKKRVIFGAEDDGSGSKAVLYCVL